MKAATTKPVITKLSPNVTDIGEMARVVIDAGTDGISDINTLMGMAVDTGKRLPVLGNNVGGLSGSAIKPVALLNVWKVFQEARKHDIDIVGQGGITTGTDAVEFIMAGAKAIGVGTALFKNPCIPTDILSDIKQIMQANDWASLDDIHGTLTFRST